MLVKRAGTDARGEREKVGDTGSFERVPGGVDEFHSFLVVVVIGRRCQRDSGFVALREECSGTSFLSWTVDPLGQPAPREGIWQYSLVV